MILEEKYFLKYQQDWIRDKARLRLCQKGRQIGLSYVDSYDSVRKAAVNPGGRDVWVMSRDETQAKQYIRYCKHWASVLDYAAEDHKEDLLIRCRGRTAMAQVLNFEGGARIFALSSNPDAIVGKSGHVKLDEFALHKDQRTLYAVAKPVIQWGGTLSVISTHRGAGTVFNEIITDIAQGDNRMGWSLHTIPIQRAVEEGLVERINAANGRSDSRDEWLARQRAECIDEEQWLQEYCCVPADEAAAFISYDLINACTEPGLGLMGLEELLERLLRLHEPRQDGSRTAQRNSPHPGPLPVPWHAATRGESQAGCSERGGSGVQWAKVRSENSHSALVSASERSGNPQSAFYLGVDVARHHDLCVLDVGEKIGDVVWDRLRLEFRDRPFAEIEEALFRLLRLPQLKRACIDATGLGAQLAERAQDRFNWKIEPITFTARIKEDLAIGLKIDLEKRHLRLADDEKLRADLRGIRKEVTLGGNSRYAGEIEGSHCDRFWAKALRQQAARTPTYTAARVG